MTLSLLHRGGCVGDTLSLTHSVCKRDTQSVTYTPKDTLSLTHKHMLDSQQIQEMCRKFPKFKKASHCVCEISAGACVRCVCECVCMCVCVSV